MLEFQIFFDYNKIQKRYVIIIYFDYLDLLRIEVIIGQEEPVLHAFICH